MEKKRNKQKFSLFFYNPLTYAGVGLAMLVFFAECLLFGIDFLNPYSNVYLGLFTYTILPPFLFLGIVLIVAGALRKRSRVLQGVAEAQPRPIVIDPSIPHHRNTILVFLAGTTIPVAMTASIRVRKGRRSRGIAGAATRSSSNVLQDRLKKTRMGWSSAIPSTFQRCGKK